MPMFEYIEMMQKKSGRGSGAEADGSAKAAR
jgi:hypothetical protein